MGNRQGVDFNTAVRDAVMKSDAEITTREITAPNTDRYNERPYKTDVAIPRVAGDDAITTVTVRDAGYRSVFVNIGEQSVPAKLDRDTGVWRFADAIPLFSIPDAECSVTVYNDSLKSVPNDREDTVLVKYRVYRHLPTACESGPIASGPLLYSSGVVF